MLRLLLLAAALSCAACAAAPPPKVELPVEDPTEKSTKYALALSVLGNMLEAYATDQSILCVQTKTIADKTGTAELSGGEIPKDISDMVKSAVNRIGPRVILVSADHHYINQERLLGGGVDRMRPDIVIEGSISEFDRNLQSQGSKAEGSMSVGGGKMQADLSAGGKETSGTSRITIDMNLMSYATNSLIPKMQATNTIMVFKATKEYDVGFSILGAGFGLGGSAKALQGRHGALRLLVDLTIFQLLGRYSLVPYWRCIDGMQPDPIVVENLHRQFLGWTDEQKLDDIQYYLIRQGFTDLRKTKMYDAATARALGVMAKKLGVGGAPDFNNFELYKAIYFSLPLDMGMKQKAEAALRSQAAALPPPAPPAAPAPPPTPAKAEPRAAPAPGAEQGANIKFVSPGELPF